MFNTEKELNSNNSFGLEIAEHLTKSNPKIKLIFCSAYLDRIDNLNEDWNCDLISKNELMDDPIKIVKLILNRINDFYFLDRKEKNNELDLICFQKNEEINKKGLRGTVSYIFHKERLCYIDSIESESYVGFKTEIIRFKQIDLTTNPMHKKLEELVADDLKILRIPQSRSSSWQTAKLFLTEIDMNHYLLPCNSKSVEKPTNGYGPFINLRQIRRFTKEKVWFNDHISINLHKYQYPRLKKLLSIPTHKK